MTIGFNDLNRLHYTIFGDPANGGSAIGNALSVTTGKVLVGTAANVVGLSDYTLPAININPNWLIDQINEGALYTSSTGANVLGPDGWSLRADGAGVFKVRTIADPDNAALKVLEITCTTADASIAAGDKYHIFTSPEGNDCRDLMAGTASASQITIMFPTDLSVTGTYGIAIQNSAANRRYIGTVTQAVANAREQQVVTLTLDTSGTWLYTDGAGLTVHLTLAAGSTYQATAGAWAAGAELTTSAQANFMSSTSNIGYIGRFHIIPGGVALAYANHDMQKELAKAQRSYAKTFPQGTAVAQASAVSIGAIYVFGTGASANPGGGAFWRYPVTQRGVPAITTYNHVTATANWRNVTGGADIAVAVGTGSPSDSAANFYINGVVATGIELLIHATANARLS